MQGEALALKGLGLVAALGTTAPQQLCWSDNLPGLLELLVDVMAGPATPRIRNTAHYAMGALHDSLKVCCRSIPVLPVNLLPVMQDRTSTCRSAVRPTCFGLLGSHHSSVFLYPRRAVGSFCCMCSCALLCWLQIYDRLHSIMLVLRQRKACVSALVIQRVTQGVQKHWPGTPHAGAHQIDVLAGANTLHAEVCMLGRQCQAPREFAAAWGGRSLARS